MVKVIIIEEDSGERRELTGDFTVATVASDKGNGYSTDYAIVGEFDDNQFLYFLAQVALDNINSVFRTKTPAERIDMMNKFKDILASLIIDEIKENKDALNLTDEMNFFLALITYMEKEENNGN